MLFTRVRVRPWSCLWVFCSVGRTTTIVPSSWLTRISGCSVLVRLPFGPFTVSRRPSIVTSTPDGTAMGRRPIRDIDPRLPDVREDFAAELGLTGLLAGHDALARADDDDAEAAEHPRDVGLARVHAQARLADALEAGDDRDLPVDVLEGQAQDRRGPVLLLVHVGDEALVLEDAGDLTLGPRRRHDHLGVTGARRVPDAREHVRDRVGDVHRVSYQLDLVTPGSSPRSARSRKQMRHSANRRM